jgi:ABC-type Fe3+-hydroxamate transport system substrate-binding protein
MPKTVEDDLCREVTFEFPPRRIVSLCPSLTETLFALGLNAEVVGRTSYCVHPDERVRNVATVGGTQDVDIDRVRALKPDLIIAAKEENSQETVEALAGTLPVYVVDAADFEDALSAIAALGDLTDRTAAAASLADSIRAAFADLRPRTTHRVAYLVWRDPYMAVGADTYICSLLAKCGCANVCAHLTDRYPEVTIEMLRSFNPEWVLLPSEPFPFDDTHVAELAPQVAPARVTCVDGQMFSWYGSRMLVAAEYLKRFAAELDCSSSR